jgi:hypothetical protein
MNLSDTRVLAALSAAASLAPLPVHAAIFEVEAKCKGEWQVEVELTENDTVVGSTTLSCARGKAEAEIDVGAAIVNDGTVTATRGVGLSTCTFVVPPGEPLESIESRCQVEAESDESEFEEQIKIEIDLEDDEDEEDDD